MVVPYVCLRCFREISRRNGQLRNASFISLRESVDRQDDNGTQRQGEEVVITGSAEPNKPQRQKKRVPFYKQYQEQRRPTGVDQVLETLFSSTKYQENVAQVSRYSRMPKEQQVDNSASQRSADRRLLELHKLLQRGDSRLDYIWGSCQQLLAEADWTNGDKAYRETGIVFRDILLAVCSKQQIVVHQTVVTPATVIEIYRKHGVMRYWWHQVLWAQLAQVVQLQNGFRDVTSEGDTNSKISRLLQNLLQVWHIFTDRYHMPGSPISIGVDAQKPAASGQRAAESKSPKEVVDQFLCLLPEHPNIGFASSVSAAAIMTIDFLDVENHPCSPRLSDFFRKIRHAGDLNIDVARAGLSGAGLPSEKIESVLKKWQAELGYYAKRRVVNRDSLGERKPIAGLDWSKKKMAMRMSDISMALKNADAEDITNLWENYLNCVNTDRSIDKPTNDWILAQFLSAFWAQRYANQAIEVWNHIVKLGQTPAPMHWTAMLTGCAQARDTISLQGIWTNMLRSNVKPDLHIWTTYIHGLIKNHKWQEGLQALEALGRTWKGRPAAGTPCTLSADTRYSPPPSTITPTIAPVHAALSALIDIQKPELTPTVMAWAKSQKLQLETYTFNILLKPIVRNGTQAQIQSHLAQMAEHKCAPDVVTFTILLNGIVSNRDSDFLNLPSEAQESTITSFLEDMEDKGVPPNHYTYAVLLEGLLGSEHAPRDSNNTKSSNIAAARTIIEHMRKRNISPNRYIYTIFVAHYFRSTPPNVQAVDTLWASIRHDGKTHQLDPVFYDRMIEGYADADEIEKALKFLRWMPNEGKSPGWTALWKVLLALDRAQEWDLCKELMRDVVDLNGGLLRHGQSSWTGKRQFYELVDELRAKGVVM